MDNALIQKMKDEVYRDTTNRSKGSLKRAIWYGNNNVLLGQHKGVRKAIRNSPKTIAMGGLGAALTNVAPGLSDLINKSVDVALNKCKTLYSKSDLKSKYKKPASFEEGLRKTVKKEIKEKKDQIVVIDRNLVKMKDALHKVSPATKAMMSAVTQPGGGANAAMSITADKEKEKKVYDALKSVSESEYYILKVISLIATQEEAMVKMQADLKRLLDATQETGKEIEDYIEALV